MFHPFQQSHNIWCKLEVSLVFLPHCQWITAPNPPGPSWIKARQCAYQIAPSSDNSWNIVQGSRRPSAPVDRIITAIITKASAPGHKRLQASVLRPRLWNDRRARDQSLKSSTHFFPPLLSPQSLYPDAALHNCTQQLTYKEVTHSLILITHLPLSGKHGPPHFLAAWLPDDAAAFQWNLVTGTKATHKNPASPRISQLAAAEKKAGKPANLLSSALSQNRVDGGTKAEWFLEHDAAWILIPRHIFFFLISFSREWRYGIGSHK